MLDDNIWRHRRNAHTCLAKADHPSNKSNTQGSCNLECGRWQSSIISMWLQDGILNRSLGQDTKNAYSTCLNTLCKIPKVTDMYRKQIPFCTLSPPHGEKRHSCSTINYHQGCVNAWCLRPAKVGTLYSLGPAISIGRSHRYQRLF